MDFDSIPEDLSLCEPHWSSKATAGELPSGEGSDHEARLVGVGDNYGWIDEDVAGIIYWMWKLGIKTVASCHDFYDHPDEAWKSCFIDFGLVDGEVEAKKFLEAAFDPSQQMISEWNDDKEPIPLDLWIQMDHGFQVTASPRWDSDTGWDLTGGPVHIEFLLPLAGYIEVNLGGRFAGESDDE